MSRIGEVTLSIIGAVLFVFLIFAGIGANIVSGSETVQEEFINTMMNEEPSLTETDIENIRTFFDFASGVGIYFIVVGVIAIVLGIVATVLLKGDKNPKAAGILLIITGVLGAVLTLFIGFFGGLLYLIAGIMALVRKPPVTKNVSEPY